LSEDFRKNPTFAIAAVRANLLNIDYVAGDLQHDHDFLIAAHLVKTYIGYIVSLVLPILLNYLSASSLYQFDSHHTHPNLISSVKP
jgi:hypothetical protein